MTGGLVVAAAVLAAGLVLRRLPLRERAEVPVVVEPRSHVRLVRRAYDWAAHE